MATPKTPGVYREEVSLFPPSVAAVETAVPAFVGHTAKATDRSGDLKFKAIEVGSIAEFREKFGEGPPVDVERVNLNLDNTVSDVVLNSNYYLYDSMRLFYDNGGGKCFIVSVGSFDEEISKEALKKGLEAVALEDVPTMLVMPDAIALGSDIYSVQTAALAQCGNLQDRFAIFDLIEVGDNGDPVDPKESVKEFRTEIGTSNLKYGAAYVPHLRVNLPKNTTFRSVRGKIKRQGVDLNARLLIPDEVEATLTGVNDAIDDVDVVRDAISTYVDGIGDDEVKTIAQVFNKANTAFRTLSAEFEASDPTVARLNALIVAYRLMLDRTYKLIQVTVDAHAKPDADSAIKTQGIREFARGQITNILKTSVERLNRMTVDANDQIGGVVGNNKVYTNFPVTAAEWGGIYANDLVGFADAELRAIFPQEIDDAAPATEKRRKNGQNMASAAKVIVQIFDRVKESAEAILEKGHQTEKLANDALRDASPIIRDIIDQASEADSTIPPSGVMAGIYSRVDRTRGVFKAPANESISNVSSLTQIISHEDQETLNVDSLAGKSINAIRPFLGRGKLVWGARTLDGNSNEWRYISVRRFFNMVEESCKNASERFVFEPNDKNTWVKVRGMIENFLLVQWRAGALQGAVPEDAFFVKVGLGETMTALDILEGRMIVEIGMAVVRPAEFIILRFSHKMPVS